MDILGLHISFIMFVYNYSVIKRAPACEDTSTRVHNADNKEVKKLVAVNFNAVL